MQSVRESWTDPRLDELNHRVDVGFEDTKREFQAVRMEMRTEFQAVRSEMRAEFQAVRSEMKGEFASVRSEIAGLRGEMGELRSEMATLNRSLVQISFAALTALMVGFAGTIATILAQG